MRMLMLLGDPSTPAERRAWLLGQIDERTTEYARLRAPAGARPRSMATAGSS
jgi:hypothetical protein